MSDIVITKSKQKGKAYIVELDTGDNLKLSPETVFKHGIFENASFPAERWLDILHEALAQQCFEKILQLSGQRMHAEKELQQKLYKKKFDKTIIQKALDRAREAGVVNDKRFAEMFVEEKTMAGNQGRLKITATLRKRGVPNEFIDAAFAGYEKKYGDDAAFSELMIAAKRKWKNLQREENPHKRKQKFLSFLASRGFKADEAYKALDQVRDPNDPDNWQDDFRD